MLTNEKHLTALNSPIQTIKSRVELHSGSTLVQICTCEDYVSSFTVERVGENKFFGYGICHKLTANFIDVNRELNLTNIDFIEVTYGVDGDFIYPYPIFYIEEVYRDETTNEIKVTAFDALYKATDYTVSDLGLASYTIGTFAAAIATKLGLPMKIIGVDDGVFDTYFPEGANFDGTENLRVALNAIAEATQTIYYISGDWELTFKRLQQSDPSMLTLDKDKYIELKTGASCTLAAIGTLTDLGDNTETPKWAGNQEEGVTQYVHNNPFWDLSIDIQTVLDNAMAAVGGLTINPFECPDWTGNYLLEIGDKITLIAENDSEINTRLVDDVITFDGTLTQSTRWEYSEDEAETFTNSTSLGDVLNQTIAKVDKANKEITLLTSSNELNKTSIGSLTVTTGQIRAEVNSVETMYDDLEDRTNKLEKDISLKVGPEDVTIAIQTELSTGVEKVVTSDKKYKFDDTGLDISTSTSNISTKITEDGMIVKRKNEEVLIANNDGVIAEDLHAKTYLTIGNNSEFKDWNENRTACFWIGGK